MELKWFEQKEYTGKRLHLYKKEASRWVLTPWFIDCADRKAHYTNGKKYGVYGAGMAKSGCASCFGGFSKLTEAKALAEVLAQVLTRIADPAPIGGTLEKLF